MNYRVHTTGDKELDKLITDHTNAVFDCGEFRDVGEDPGYDEDRKFTQYEEAAIAAEKTREALFTALRNRLQMGKNEVQK